MRVAAAPSAHAWTMDSVEWDPFGLAATQAESEKLGDNAAPFHSRDARLPHDNALTPRLRHAHRAGCQVPGCTSTLAVATSDEGRAILCDTHAAADVLALPAKVRYCQKCRRLHALCDFSGKQPSCRATLALDRQRRTAESATDLSEEDNLLSCPPTEQHLDFSSLSTLLLGIRGRAGDTGPYNSLPPPPPPPPDADSWPIPLPECVSLELKLPLLPSTALPSTGVRTQLLASLSIQVGPGVTCPGRSASPVAAQLFGTIKPSRCTHLTVDATFVAPPPGDSPLRSADAAGKALMAGAPSIAAAGRMEVGLRRCGAVGSVASVALRGASTPLVGGTPCASPLLASPMALLSGAGGSQLTLRHASGLTVPPTIAARLNGQLLHVGPPLSCSDGSIVVTLPPTHAEGCACVDAQEGVSSEPLCVVLLSASQRLVDEVNATACATSPHAQRALGALQQACWAVGQALALRQPHVAAATPPARARLLAAHGAACALRFGWHAALEECLLVAAASHEEEQGWEDGCSAAAAAAAAKAAALTSHGATLLHQAAHAGCHVAAARLMQLPARLRGGCGQSDEGGSSALHVAARRGAGGVMAALCAQRPVTPGGQHDDASAGEGARALLAFWAAREGWEGGATPAQLAQQHAELAPLTAHLRRRVADAARLAYAALPSGPPLAVTSLEVAHRRLRDGPPSPHTAVAMELLKALLAGAIRRDQALSAAHVRADAIALLSSAAVYGLWHHMCILSRSALGVLTDQEVLVSLQQSSWQPDKETWQRIPTCMCGNTSSYNSILRWAMIVTAVGVALVALTARRTCRRRRGAAVSLMHCVLLLHVLILNPAWLAITTYRRFGGVGMLRRPSRAGALLLSNTALSHLASGTRAPPRAYAAVMICRGMMSLVARVALAGPVWLHWLAWIKLVDANPWLDGLNLVIALAAAAHNAAAHRERQLKEALLPKASC